MFETEKEKKGYRQCGYLPQPPTSRILTFEEPINKKKYGRILEVKKLTTCHCGHLQVVVLLERFFVGYESVKILSCVCVA